MPLDIAFDGGEALERTAVTGDDVLDRPPGRHGDDESRLLVHPGERAVMMLTAAETLGDRVTGLRIRADHYLPKSFHMLTPVDYRSAER